MCCLSCFGVPVSAYILTLSKSVGLVGRAPVMPARAPAAAYKYSGASGLLAPNIFLYGSYVPSTRVLNVNSLIADALAPLYSPLAPSYLKTWPKFLNRFLCSYGFCYNSP